jgi:hypothetical protein
MLVENSKLNRMPTTAAARGVVNRRSVFPTLPLVIIELPLGKHDLIVPPKPLLVAQSKSTETYNHPMGAGSPSGLGVHWGNLFT